MLSKKCKNYAIPQGLARQYIYIYIQGWTQCGTHKDLGPLGPNKKNCSTCYIFHFCSQALSSKTLSLLLSNQPSQPSPTSNYPTQKLNKNNKRIHNSNCILAKILFTTKKPCSIGEVKTKCFATTINWYKYQLTVVSC